MKDICVSWKEFGFEVFVDYIWLVFTWNIYGKSVTKTFWGAFFWVPIPFKQYQNTSGCSTDFIGRTAKNKWTVLKIEIDLK